jgi:hypothetical protein
MCLRFAFLLIPRLAAGLRLSRREETWKAAGGASEDLRVRPVAVRPGCRRSAPAS